MLAAALPGAWTPARAGPEPITVPLALTPSHTHGIARRMLDLLAQDGQLRWQIHVVPWRRALRMAERDEALVWGVSRNPQREETLEFSDLLYSSAVWLISRADDARRLVELQDLRGRTLCLSRGISFGPEFDSAAEQMFQVEYADKSELDARMRMLAAGRCDVVSVSAPGKHADRLQRRLERRGWGPERFRVHEPALMRSGIHLAVAKGGSLAALLPQINLRLAQHSGAVQQLLRRREERGAPARLRA